MAQYQAVECPPPRQITHASERQGQHWSGKVWYAQLQRYAAEHAGSNSPAKNEPPIGAYLALSSKRADDHTSAQSSYAVMRRDTTAVEKAPAVPAIEKTSDLDQTLVMHTGRVVPEGFVIDGKRQAVFRLSAPPAVPAAATPQPQNYALPRPAGSSKPPAAQPSSVPPPTGSSGNRIEQLLTTINDTLADTYPLTGRRIAIGLSLAFLTWSTIHYWGPRVEGYLTPESPTVIVQPHEGQHASTEPIEMYTCATRPCHESQGR